MRIQTFFRPVVATGLTALVAVVVASCNNTVSFSGPEEPEPTGFEGDWVGTFQGSEMVLRVGDFALTNQAPARVLWRDIEWDALCTVMISPEASEIDCDVIPSAEVEFCGDPTPFIDIDGAVPRSQLNASVGGLIREGSGSPCDGEILVSWEPGEGVIFTPG